MAEDIKILKEWIEISIGNAPEWVKSDEIIKIIDYKQIQAIENLIKGYRELEYKYNKALTDLSIEAKRTNEENYRCSLFAVENNDLKEKLADSIPKSKIKEKINAYSKSCAVVDAFIVDVLQELMEEK